MPTTVFGLPPVSAKLQIVSKFANDSSHRASLARAGITGNTIDQIKTFSWHDPKVNQLRKLPKFDPQWMSHPSNQSSCGSCWAVSSTNVLHDRCAIAWQQSVPELSCVPVVNCAGPDPDGNGCDGGFPGFAGCFFEQIGTIANVCLPYAQFCGPDNGNCQGVPCCSQRVSGKPNLSQVANEDGSVPFQCPNLTDRIQGCGSGPGLQSCPADQSRRYKAKPGSTVSLGQGSRVDVIHRMKSWLFSTGPIVSTYSVYGDFMLPFASINVNGQMTDAWDGKWGWKMTRGIYVHRNDQMSDYALDPFITDLYNNTTSIYRKRLDDLTGGIVSSSNSLEDFQRSLDNVLKSRMGGHAIALVGWDESDPDFPCWIAQNSWGSQWNEQGYFRIAYSNEAKDIQKQVGIDVPYMLGDDGTMMGGATAWIVDAVVTVNKNTGGSGSGSGSGSDHVYHPMMSRFKSLSTGQKVGLVVTALVGTTALGVLIYVIVKHRVQIQHSPVSTG